MKNHAIFLLAPLSRSGLIFANHFIKNNHNVIAAIDDRSSSDEIFSVPRWTSNNFLEKAKDYPSAIAIDFSSRSSTKRWATELCNRVGIERVAFYTAMANCKLAPYAPITPVANYSPWLEDTDFQFVFQEIADSTLVDHLRLWELWTLLEQTRYIPGDILEIGVWRGGTGALMAWKLQQQKQQSNIYLCDTFTGVVKAGAFDSCYTGGEHADTSREHVENLLSRLTPSQNNIHILEGIFPEETGEIVKDNNFRLVHIDVDTYQSAQDILDFIWPKVSPGGIVVYDDYGFDCCSGITKHVNDLKNRQDMTIIQNLNGHALLIKR